MKQASDTHIGHKGHVDMGADPAVLMDQAAAQLAATLQDSVLQNMAGHGHKRLKDLTSRVLNGEQNKVPKLCAAEGSLLKAADGPPQHDAPQMESTQQLKIQITKMVPKSPPLFPPSFSEDSALSAEAAAPEDTPCIPIKKKPGRKKKRKRSVMPCPQPQLSPLAVPPASPVKGEVAQGSTTVSSFCVQSKPPVPPEGDRPMQVRFFVGDVVWTKVSGYPWWPCMVTMDPALNQHVKQKAVNSRRGLLYHVQYFGDTPERGYIFERSMVTFGGKEQYQELCKGNGKQLASRADHKKTRPSVPLKLRAQWSVGISQATEAAGMALEDRIAKFTFTYISGRPQLNPRVLVELPSAISAASGTAAAAEQNMPYPSVFVFSCCVRLFLGSKASQEVKKAPKRILGVAVDSAEAPRKRVKVNGCVVKQKTESTATVKSMLKIKASSLERKCVSESPQMDNSGNSSPAKSKRGRKRKQVLDSSSLVSPQRKSRVPSDPETECQASECSEQPESPVEATEEACVIKKGERGHKRDIICQVCEESGEVQMCEGQCCGAFHLQCLGVLPQPRGKFLCQSCETGVHPCFSCKRTDGEVQRCTVQQCGKFYHEACARLSALSVFQSKGFRCPLHTCLSCHLSSRTKHKATKGKMFRCVRCPVAYHTGDLCVAAGSQVLAPSSIICTNHFNRKKSYSHHSHVNVSWCFICSKGGSLLCCESCPAAFHPDCLNIAMPDGSWFCNDCRAGKKPKYQDIIWVKLGKYRWWPAEIRHPRSVPVNIQHMPHNVGEFPVFFFGSKDYFWTHQARVFPYMEGDRGIKYKKNGIGKVFQNALLEAEMRFNEIRVEREAKEAQENERKPPPYKYIKVNKPCGRVQIYTADIAEIPKCNCKPTDEKPCGFESECLNRMLMYECHPQVCPAGAYCHNQAFTKRQYPDTKVIKTAGKGWGLVTLRDIKKGEFVNEYVGEVIDEEECRARIKYAQENGITHFYMLTIDKDRIIDAGPKGNYSRFMNHSCQPNCETQKWTVNGDTRVGLFAVCDIPADTELTFNYNLDCLGNEKTVCRCGAPNCSGFLGDRPKNSSGQTSDIKGKKPKKKLRKRKARTEGKKRSEDECFRCGDGGQLVLCDRKSCTKAYHLSCLDRTKRPFGRWDCPWHHCDVCGKNSEAFCQLCPNSFCKAHQEGALRLWVPTGQLCCQEHEDLELQNAVDNRETEPPPVDGPRPLKNSQKA
ncbi:histone-lysine N-methyltransferase NSD2-like [Scleropages formosus]|uniref:Histone-lysine N-methyltransferase NSD2-like n=1 Tax=Scleropages formosus TaxID=113540 RepID=A0A0P7VDR8_SCLFO|nr:histone-lysine N-methyltransferase NSD2-like [Scleropages formosus]